MYAGGSLVIIFLLLYNMILFYASYNNKTRESIGWKWIQQYVYVWYMRAIVVGNIYPFPSYSLPFHLQSFIGIPFVVYTHLFCFRKLDVAVRNLMDFSWRESRFSSYSLCKCFLRNQLVKDSFVNRFGFEKF